MRRLAITLAALLSAPLAAAAVFIEWAQLPRVAAADASLATWAARSFMAYFDLGVVCLLIPSLLLCARMRSGESGAGFPRTGNTPAGQA